MVLKNNLQAYRWKKEWSQRELAHYSGVSCSLICQIENGGRPNPTITTALLLSKALEVSVHDLFTLVEGGDRTMENVTKDKEEGLLKRIEELEKENEMLWNIVKTSNRTINRMIDNTILKK